MSEPDELYTLRAQYWLGHYQMALDEAKSIARRPMSPKLKAEREEFQARAHIGLGRYDTSFSTETPGLQALALKAQFHAATGNAAAQENVVNQLKTMGAGGDNSGSVALTAAQVLLEAGQTKEALALVHSGTMLEESLLRLQIYLKLDRIDLATNEWKNKLHKMDEDSVICQLAGVYVNLASGQQTAPDASHALNSLSEQYGTSPFLANLVACALLQQGDYSAAEQALQESLDDSTSTGNASMISPDTLINMVVAATQQNKPCDNYVQQLQSQFPTHPFCAGLERVTAAFDREAIKYQV